jgi:hypothetical protein
MLSKQVSAYVMIHRPDLLFIQNGIVQSYLTLRVQLLLCYTNQC